jgi:hypothetical protein
MAEHPPASGRSQRLAGIGGWLVIAGCVLVLVTAAFGFAGQPVTIGSDSLGGVVLALALGALAAGFGALAAVGSPSLGGLAARIGLALLAVGAAGIVLSSVIAGGLNADPLEEVSFVVPFLGGALATVVGIPLTVVGLLLHAGTPRRIAAAFLGGIAVVIAGGFISSALLANDPTAASLPLAAALVGAAGLGIVLLSIGALGMTAIRAARSPEAAAA